jgi:DnaJ-class molecular chaperone
VATKRTHKPLPGIVTVLFLKPRKSSDPLYDTDCADCKGTGMVKKLVRRGFCGEGVMRVICPRCKGKRSLKP